MAWTVPLPQDNWSERDKNAFLREVWMRYRNAFVFAWDAPSVGAGDTVDTTLTSATVPQLGSFRAGMPVYVSPPPSITAGLHVTGAWVPADGQLTIRLYNSTGGGIDLGSADWSVGGALL